MTLSDDLAEISGKVRHIEKKGTAPDKIGGFRYVRETDVIDEVAPLLAEKQIILRPEVKLVDLRYFERGTSTPGSIATVELILTAVRREEELLFSKTLGQGADTQDKAIAKATTAAKKQGYLIALNIATGEDPEADDVDARRPQARRQPAAAPAARQSAAGDPRRERLAYLEGLVAQVKATPTRDLNEFSLRNHIKKTLGMEGAKIVAARGTTEQIEQLIDYIEAKLGGDQDPPESVISSPENMSPDEAYAAGAALVPGRKVTP